MAPLQDRSDAAFLKRTELPPTQRIDDVVLDGGMEARKGTHNLSSISSTEPAGVAAFSASFNSLGTKDGE